jgi:DNA-3-methyladenine glycosylase
MNEVLPLSFYCHDDVVSISRDLLGKVLCTRIDGLLATGMIVETEAYSDIERACHAFGGRRTARTETFYQWGGVSYVYLCYGIHHLFNIITNAPDRADAVLIRAIAPIDGVAIMAARRNIAIDSPRLTAGPGTVTTALGITKLHNSLSLHSDTIWVEDRGIAISSAQIMTTTRIGVEGAGADGLLPWRFFVQGNRYVSSRRR